MPVTSGMRFVRLISEEKLPESVEGAGQIQLRRREAISGRKTKGATRKKQKRKRRDLTRARFLPIVTQRYDQHTSFNLSRKCRKDRRENGEVLSPPVTARFNWTHMSGRFLSDLALFRYLNPRSWISAFSRLLLAIASRVIIRRLWIQEYFTSISAISVRGK